MSVIRPSSAKYAIVSYILHMWISRDVEARLKRSAKTRPVIVLTGAGQTGRTGTVHLDALTFAEIREAQPNTELEKAIVRGGFPELYANPDIDSVAFYNSYLATYLERDVRSLANVGSLRDFERFLRACA